MNGPVVLVLRVLGPVISVLLVVPTLAAEQLPGGKERPTAAAKGATPLRTPDGHPDLQGVWSFATITPLERPSELAGKEVLTDEEAAELQNRTLASRRVENRDESTRGIVNGSPTTADVEAGYNEFWKERGTKVIATKRTSLVLDPPDGRIPPPSVDGQKTMEIHLALLQRPAAGPEDRGADERCILGFNSGPPMVPGGYNQNVQLIQAPGYVVLVNEMVHNARIVPLDGRPHGNVPQWAGTSRGHWEGDTLVVDTTNFYERRISSGGIKISSRNLHLVERFRRIDADTLLYEFTVDDPTTWTRRWTAQIPMTKTEGLIYEYACHEGNYSMFNLLAGARAQEEVAAQATGKASK